MAVVPCGVFQTKLPLAGGWAQCAGAPQYIAGMTTIPSPRDGLLALFHAAVHSAMPSHTLAAHLPAPPKGRTLVLGAGKAAGAMVHALEAAWPLDAPLSGLVVTRYGHTPQRPPGVAARVEIVEASHPSPDGHRPC